MIQQIANNNQADSRSNASQKTNDGKNLINPRHQSKDSIFKINERAQNNQKLDPQSNASQKTNDGKNCTYFNNKFQQNNSQEDSRSNVSQQANKGKNLLDPRHQSKASIFKIKERVQNNNQEDSQSNVSQQANKGKNLLDTYEDLDEASNFNGQIEAIQPSIAPKKNGYIR